MYNIKVKTACKIKIEDLFTGEKETIELIPNQIVKGRIDSLSGDRLFIVLEDGRGGEIGKNLVEKIID